MGNPWFRLYSEFASDHKMQMMSEAYQRRYVMLLCLRCSNGDVTLQDEEVAFQLRISIDEWSSTKAVFIAKNLIDKHNRVLAWERRQFISDSSVERVRKHREKKKRFGNVTVTPPDTEQNRTDADKETEKTNTVATEVADPVLPVAVKPKKQRKVVEEDPLFEQFWLTYDYNIDRYKALKSWNSIKPDAELAAKICQAADRYARSTPDRAYRRHPTTWLNNRSWENEIVDKRMTRIPEKTQHQLNQEAVTRSIFGHLYSPTGSNIIEGDVINATENPPPLLG